MIDLNHKFPIGIQTFEKLREGGYLYVDKTALLWKIASTSTPYILSRPRRFGKSLLLSTFEAYFKGKKELFGGLAIEKLETEWKEYPVLHLDLNAEKYDSLQALHAILSSQLTQWELKYGHGVDEETLSQRFIGVIRRASELTGRGVVMLIDEYDKPLLQALNNGELLDEYCNTLKAFYGVLKSTDRYLRFVFLTGVTKFAQDSVFSDLNQLNDISLDFAYSTICGITREELITTFVSELRQLSKKNGMSQEKVMETISRKYGGYHFHHRGEEIFNPFSLFISFDKLEFGNYWFQMNEPSFLFLFDFLRKSGYTPHTLFSGMEVAASSFIEYRIKNKNLIALIYQSGYLTIKGYNKEFQLYRLEVPNEEVKFCLLNIQMISKLS